LAKAPQVQGEQAPGRIDWKRLGEQCRATEQTLCRALGLAGMDAQSRSMLARLAEGQRVNDACPVSDAFGRVAKQRAIFAQQDFASLVARAYVRLGNWRGRSTLRESSPCTTCMRLPASAPAAL